MCEISILPLLSKCDEMPVNLCLAKHISLKMLYTYQKYTFPQLLC